MRINNYILLFILFLTFVSCDPALKDGPNAHTTITFVNNSDKALYVSSYHVSVEKMYDLSSLYKSAMANHNEKVESNDTYNRRALCLVWNYWESVLSPNANPRQDTIWVYVADADKLEREKACYRNTILYCYGLTLSDLRRLKWIVTYPPTPEMKDIKMFPAYCEKPIYPVEEDVEISTN